MGVSMNNDLSSEEYHALKALSAGFVWEFDAECPRKAWLASPWNDARKPVNATHFDIGTGAHLAVLEPELLRNRVVVHDFDTYHTKESRTIRDDAYAVGMTPLKPAEWATVEGIQSAILGHPTAHGLFKGGMAEVSLTWEWDGMTCKARPDFLAANSKYVLDLKTANTCNPRAISRKAATEGWHVRACWYMAGVKEVTGTLPDKYLFVVVEKDAPYLIEIFEMDQRALMYGDQIIMRTLKRTAECFRANHWPSYGDGSIKTIALPSWTEFERAEREEAGEFEE